MTLIVYRDRFRAKHKHLLLVTAKIIARNFVLSSLQFKRGVDPELVCTELAECVEGFNPYLLFLLTASMKAM